MLCFVSHVLAWIQECIGPERELQTLNTNGCAIVFQRASEKRVL